MLGTPRREIKPSIQHDLHIIPGINLGGAMGKIAADFSKWPLHLESMGPFYNVKGLAVTFLYESISRNGPCHC